MVGRVVDAEKPRTLGRDETRRRVRGGPLEGRVRGRARSPREATSVAGGGVAGGEAGGTDAESSLPGVSVMARCGRQGPGRRGNGVSRVG